MRKLAVDAVLLPEEKMADKAIEINRKLLDKGDHEIVLAKTDCVPHISLAMGVVTEGNIERIGDVLEELGGEVSLGRLYAKGVVTSMQSGGREVSVIEIEKSRSLQFLHEQIMGRLGDFFGGDVSAEMFVEPEQIGPSTLRWVAEYAPKAAFENFYPHITAGYGRAPNEGFPMAFEARKLALYQFGCHCTCRKLCTWADI